MTGVESSGEDDRSREPAFGRDALFLTAYAKKRTEGVEKMTEVESGHRGRSPRVVHIEGDVSTRVGPVLARGGFFEAVINGKGGHGALPHNAINLVLAASNVVVSLQSLASREADHLDPWVVTVGYFQGGGAYNVIPDSVTIGGTFRGFLREGLEHLSMRIEEVITGQAAVQRRNATVTFGGGHWPRTKVYGYAMRTK